MQLVTQGECVDEGAPTQHPGFKVTADKARLQNAAKGQQGCTSFILQLLCFGVTVNDWTNSVKYMVEKPQSCLRAFVLRNDTRTLTLHPGHEQNMKESENSLASSVPP